MPTTPRRHRFLRGIPTAVAMLLVPAGAAAGGMLTWLAILGVMTDGHDLAHLVLHTLPLFLVVWIMLTLLTPITVFPLGAIGLPVHWLLVALKKTGWLAYGLAGGVVGAVLAGVLGIPGDAETLLDRLLCGIGGGGAGIGGALAFWAALRPDQDEGAPGNAGR